MTHCNQNLAKKILKVSTITAVLTILLILMMPVSMVFADQANPDSTPTVAINIWRNILETGDYFVLIFANIPYGSTPDTDVTDAFIWQLIDTDNATELGSTVGYNYNDSGYGYNVYSLYFSTSDNLTWGETYTLRLSGNPSIFDTPPVYNYPLLSSYYSSLTTSSDAKAAIATAIIIIAAQLDTNWGLSSTTSLLYESEVGTVLSIYGEAFFRSAVYGLQALAPALFRFSIDDITDTTRTWDTEYADNLTSQFTGTWVDTAQSGGAAMMGTGYDLPTIIFWIILATGAFFATLALSRGEVWAAFLDSVIVIVGGARLGLDPNFIGLIVAICWLYVSAKSFSVVR